MALIFVRVPARSLNFWPVLKPVNVKAKPWRARPPNPSPPGLVERALKEV